MDWLPQYPYGARIAAAIGSLLDDRRWECEVSGAPEGVAFECLSEGAHLALGDVVDLFVWKRVRDESLVVLRDAPMRSLPATAKEAATHERALETVFQFAEMGAPNSSLQTALEDVKGMVGRCVRPSRHWQEIHIAFGEPSKMLIEPFWQHLGAAAAALRQGDTAGCHRTVLELRGSALWPMLHSFRDHLRRTHHERKV